MEDFILSKIRFIIQNYSILIRKKYWISTLLFFGWILFFDGNNIYRQIKRTIQIKDLDNQIFYYQKELKNTEIERKAFFKNNQYFEKFVRENYLLKKENEDIFVFTENQEK
jgi:cell division protein DivIC